MQFHRMGIDAARSDVDPRQEDLKARDDGGGSGCLEHTWRGGETGVSWSKLLCSTPDEPAGVSRADTSSFTAWGSTQCDPLLARNRMV